MKYSSLYFASKAPLAARAGLEWSHDVRPFFYAEGLRPYPFILGASSYNLK